jgi:hypothetical protein
LPVACYRSGLELASSRLQQAGKDARPRRDVIERSSNARYR